MAGIRGTDGRNTLRAKGTSDRCYGLANDDVMSGGGGDWMSGGEGHDWMDGGSGFDALFGGEGFDTMHGGEGDHEDPWGTQLVYGCPLRVKANLQRCPREHGCGRVSGLGCGRLGRGPR